MKEQDKFTQTFTGSVFKQGRGQLDSIADGMLEQGRKQLDAIADGIIEINADYNLTFDLFKKDKIVLDFKEYFDNDCKGEDTWGQYETKNGVLYIVADGASSHDGKKTGGDVARYIHEQFGKEAINISRSHHLKDLIHEINKESTRINKGAYAAIAGVLYRGTRVFCFGAGDVSIIARKPNGKLLQVLPLDLSMEREEAEMTVTDEIGSVINGVKITKDNYQKRVNQYMQHGLSNAIGFGVSFNLHHKSFNAKDGAALMIASDGITDSFMQTQKRIGNIPKENMPALYDVINSAQTAEGAAKSLEELIWDTQVKKKIKLKPDDRTALFLYMNHAETD